ncbi:hypothetical protein TYRP_002493 [Tyrophagus putrescentiae]|nr:hypothetical protein TYRP_002493 [Tyrophagus putrescentiae]
MFQQGRQWRWTTKVSLLLVAALGYHFIFFAGDHPLSAEAFLIKLHNDHKHYYKARGGYPVLGWKYWKRRIHWLFTGRFDPFL